MFNSELLGDKMDLEQLNDSDPNVRIGAAVRLAEHGNFAGRSVLLAALEDDDWRVRQRAAHWLGRIGPAWAIQPLSKPLQDHSTDVRNAVIFALLNIGRSTVVPFLLDALHDEDPDRREDAATALCSLLGRAVVDQFWEEGNEEEDANRVTAWWRENSTTFDPSIFYYRGQPASVGDLINEFGKASPQVVEILSNRLFDWTGQRFSGSHQEQASEWEQWWPLHQHAFQRGRRYFHGRPVDEIS